MNKLKSLCKIQKELLKKRYEEIPKGVTHEWKRFKLNKGKNMKADEIKQQIQDTVEETVEKVKEVLDKKETKDMLKGAAIGALLGGVAMFFGKKNES